MATQAEFDAALGALETTVTGIENDLTVQGTELDAAKAALAELSADDIEGTVSDAQAADNSARLDALQSRVDALDQLRPAPTP